MVECPWELTFPYLKRRKLVNRLSESGFTVTEIGNVFVSNPEKEHPQIEGHYLPVAVIRRFFVKLVNLDEKYFEKYHTKLREVYFSAII